jgi:hypothetical protein
MNEQQRNYIFEKMKLVQNEAAILISSPLNSGLNPSLESAATNRVYNSLWWMEQEIKKARMELDAVGERYYDQTCR